MIEKFQVDFDHFNYFIAEEQEQQSSGNTGKGKRRKTLKDLFKPPLDIMHKGTFETVSIIACINSLFIEQ